MQEHFEKKLHEVRKILKDDYRGHEKEIERIRKDDRLNYRRWTVFLREKFNLLLYGAGSKQEVIDDFCSCNLKDCCTLTVQGFNPKISLRDVVRLLIVDVFGKTRCPVNVNEAILTLKGLLKSNEFPVFLIVHSIDGIGLRASKNQELLSELANLPNLHLIASVDHINSPLLWSEKMLSKFNFIWINVTTFQACLDETWYKQALKNGSSGACDRDFSTFTKVYNCSSDKVKKIVGLIIKDCLENKHHDQQGLSIQDLHTRAQEEMLLSQQHLKSLNNLLKDFYEHGIIRKTASGCLTLTVNKEALSKFYESEDATYEVKSGFYTFFGFTMFRRSHPDEFFM